MSRAIFHLKELTAEVQRLNLVEIAARELVGKLREVGNESGWKDKDKTDRVYSWAEFDDLRHYLGEGEGWGS